MSKTFDPLTPEELARIERRRAEAREQARREIETADPEEDAEILAAALADLDAQPMTNEQLARLRPAHEIVPHIVAAQIRRGRPKLEAPKQRVTMRLDADVVARLRATGRGWQTRANEALRRWLEREAP
jgi:uncharacterized protein (DUF4415 family)